MCRRFVQLELWRLPCTSRQTNWIHLLQQAKKTLQLLTSCKCLQHGSIFWDGPKQLVLMAAHNFDQNSMTSVKISLSATNCLPSIIQNRTDSLKLQLKTQKLYSKNAQSRVKISSAVHLSFATCLAQTVRLLLVCFSRFPQKMTSCCLPGLSMI